MDRKTRRSVLKTSGIALAGTALTMPVAAREEDNPDEEEIGTESNEPFATGELPEDPQTRGEPITIESGDTVSFFDRSSYPFEVADIYEDDRWDTLDVENTSRGRYNGVVSGECSEKAAGSPTDFGVVMGVPFEMETDEANVFVDARLEYDLDVPGSIPTSESEQAGIEKPASDDDSSTSVDPDAVQYIPIALGGANFLVSVGDMMDNTSTHAGVQIAWFLQNLTQGTTITSDFGSDTTFDVVEVIQEGSGEHSNTLEQTDSEEGIFRSGDVYRIGAAIGGSVEVSLYRSRTDLEFEAKIKSMEIRA